MLVALPRFPLLFNAVLLSNRLFIRSYVVSPLLIFLDNSSRSVQTESTSAGLFNRKHIKCLGRRSSCVYSEAASIMQASLRCLVFVALRRL